MTNSPLTARPGSLPLIMAASLALSACGGPGGMGNAVAVRDSAGVSIIEHSGDIWNTPGTWSLSADPVIKIGAVEGGEPAYLFDRIMGVVVLSDGRIVVANGGTSTLRWFDSTGRFLFERGGAGRGPVEFMALSGITLGRGDTITAVDSWIGRLLLFSPDGTALDTWSFIGLSGPGNAYRLADGSHIMAGTGFGRFDAARLEAGFHRFPNPLVRVVRDTTHVDTLGMFLGRELLMRVQPDRRSFGGHAYAKAFHYVVHDEEIYVSTAERFEIDVYDVSGRLRRSIRVPGMDLTLDPAVARAELLAQLRADPEYEGATPEQQQEAEAELAERPVPFTRPALGGLLVDAEGNLWVGEHVLEGDRAVRWAVFARDGQLVQALALPGRFVPMAIVASRVIGRGQDDLGVQYVVGYVLQ